ncbi:WD repeat domain 65 [Perkinsus olseni]|uniref:WD repeat domain 65 n=1 Tax=Perkinsus olseni TaxID=32597 RepID=A0A7J6KUJ8_PEROL|nr:WD repeat domain 65 [Perkinsus olseni]
MSCWLGHWRLDKVAAGASRLLAWTKIAPPITGTTRKMSIRRLASQSITSVGTKSMPALSGTAGVAIVHDAACHPTDAAIVSVIGEGTFKLYRIGDGLMKPLPVQPANKNRESENTNFNFTCQAWLAEGSLLIGSEKGELFLYESNGEFKGTVSTGPGEHRSCLCAVATAKGFVLGGVDSTMRVYERSLDSKEGHLLSREFRLDMTSSVVAEKGEASPEADRRGTSREGTEAAKEAIARANRYVHCISLSPNGENIVAGVSDGQIYSVYLSAEEENEKPRGDEEGAEEVTDAQEPQGKRLLEYLSTPLHTGPITGLSVCVRRPLVATCGVDKNVVVWNYIDRTCEVSKKFEEEVLSVAIHPNGFGLIVAFADRIRLMNLLMDDIQPYKDLLVRNCREVKYSNGGHLLAVAISANQVQIYRTYSAQLFCTTVASGQASMLGSAGLQEALAAAGLGGRARVIEFSDDDSVVVVTSSEGIVYEYVLVGVEGFGGPCRSSREWRPKNRGVRAVRLCRHTIYISCSDGTIVELGPNHEGKFGTYDRVYDIRPTPGTVMNSILAPDEHEQRQASSGATLSPTERMKQNQAKSGGPQAGGPSPQPLVVPTSAGSRPALLFGSCSAMLPDSQSGTVPASEGTSVVNTIIDEHTDPECMRNGKVSLPSTLKVYIIPTSSRRDKRRTAAVPINAFMELPAHCGGITRMVLSHRDEHLFTISEDGTLMVFQIWLPSMASIEASTGVPGSPVRLSPLSAARTAVTDGSPRKGDPKQSSLPTSEETLVTRAYLDKRERLITELERQVAELGDQIEYQLRLRDEKHREKADKLEEKYSETMTKEMGSYGQLKDDKDVMVAGFEEELVQLADTHLTNLDQLEKTFDHKMDLETQRSVCL